MPALTLTAARKALSEALGAPGHVPEVIDPPCVVVEPGEPYITHAREFAWREYVANVHVYVLVPVEAETQSDDLDAALLDTLDKIEAAGWGIEGDGIGKPGLFFTSDWTAYGVRIAASARVLRTDPTPTP